MKKRAARVVGAALVVLALTEPAAALDAKTLAERIQMGDSKATVIHQADDEPSWMESSRHLGVPVEVLTFRTGLSEGVIVRLVMGRVVSISVVQLPLWRTP